MIFFVKEHSLFPIFKIMLPSLGTKKVHLPLPPEIRQFNFLLFFIKKIKHTYIQTLCFNVLNVIYFSSLKFSSKWKFKMFQSQGQHGLTK